MAKVTELGPELEANQTCVTVISCSWHDSLSSAGSQSQWVSFDN